jgi:hypothetical protein
LFAGVKPLTQGELQSVTRTVQMKRSPTASDQPTLPPRPPPVDPAIGATRPPEDLAEQSAVENDMAHVPGYEILGDLGRGLVHLGSPVISLGLLCQGVVGAGVHGAEPADPEELLGQLLSIRRARLA